MLHLVGFISLLNTMHGTTNIKFKIKEIIMDVLHNLNYSSVFIYHTKVRRRI